MNATKRVLIISYYACMPWACLAEWLDDKVDSLLKAGTRVLQGRLIIGVLYWSKHISMFKIMRSK